MKTYEETLKLLEEAVALRGEDFEYPDKWKDEQGMCTYVQPDGSGPACIVGVVAHKAGIHLETLMSHEGDSVQTTGPLWGFDSKAIDLLQHAQLRQDAGYTWGVALERAIKYTKEYDNGTTATT